MVTHSLHFAKLLANWEMQPLTPQMVGALAVPPVHYLRAELGVPWFWTEALLPTLNLQSIKVLKEHHWFNVVRFQYGHFRAAKLMVLDTKM